LAELAEMRAGTDKMRDEMMVVLRRWFIQGKPEPDMPQVPRFLSWHLGQVIDVQRKQQSTARNRRNDGNLGLLRQTSPQAI
jgi:hypothetical protein